MIDPIELAINMLERALRGLDESRHYLQYKTEGRIFNAQAVIRDAESILKHVKADHHG